MYNHEHYNRSTFTFVCINIWTYVPFLRGCGTGPLPAFSGVMGPLFSNGEEKSEKKVCLEIVALWLHPFAIVKVCLLRRFQTGHLRHRHVPVGRRRGVWPIQIGFNIDHHSRCHVSCLTVCFLEIGNALHAKNSEAPRFCILGNIDWNEFAFFVVWMPTHTIASTEALRSARFRKRTD